MARTESDKAMSGYKRLLTQLGPRFRKQSRLLPEHFLGWILFALLMTLIIVWSFFNGQTMTRIANQENNPADRMMLASTILGADGLPQGYYPGQVFVMALAPFLYGEEITLTDQSPSESGGIRPFLSAGFVYSHFPDERHTELRLMRDLLRTERGLTFETWSQKIGLEGREYIGKGRIELGDLAVDYIAQRGIVIHRDGHYPSVFCVMSIQCPDERTRMALWFGPDISGKGKEVSEATYVTGPANQNSIENFLAYFDFCSPRD